ncbi:MAG: glutamine--tRNA ligase/YqeY domain fusion protein [Candidatus Omnitrophica bacterium]|nr:glutamine--tRNA ligase/YqeY domain fusion protein [Candidatus Omnitrophota bacterium]
MNENKPKTNFIREIIDQDNAKGVFAGRVHTRFPPEPNGYLHIGHAKSICHNFGLARDYQGLCNLRFDDTNPEKENMEYVESIQEDVRWLGFDWDDRCFFASDYFERLFGYAVQLIQKGHAYVCDLNAEDVRLYRGTLKEPGKNSPNRERSVDENLDLFSRMRAGEFPDGAKTLRAKIDMASPHIIMRDPALYRIKRQHHFRSGDTWCIYPMYDFAHCLSDSIENITHSCCTLEFENNRRLYDWILDQLEVYHPKQIEFARLNLSYTVLSKRKLLQLVNEKHVDGWDDPRMPTISGLRRRGFTPASIRDFCDQIGVARFNSTIDRVILENSIRDELNKTADRVMGVLKPLKVVIENYPEDQEELLEAVNNPEDPEAGSRQVPFSKELYIEHDDFMEEPPKKFFRLAPGREVRLRYAYFIRCESVIRDDQTGHIKELRCTYDPETKGGNAPDGRKVKATLHWVSAKHAFAAEVRLYDHLFLKENPDDVSDGKTFLDNLNTDSLQVISTAYLEPCVQSAKAYDRYQFERLGYFCVDPKHSKEGAPVFNRTVTLRDAWAKVQKSESK